MTIVSPYLSFPCISWWAYAANAETVILDGGEHFEKMSYRNRYRISGSNNPILLTVPMTGGRDHKAAMKDIQIFNENKWQVQHWRTLVSVYKRSPYFEHYEPELQPLFEQEFSHLTTFNKEALNRVKKALRLQFKIEETGDFVKEYPGAVTDLRRAIPPIKTPAYYQLFEDRIGFQEDLSILDVLFSMGPATTEWLKKLPV